MIEKIDYHTYILSLIISDHSLLLSFKIYSPLHFECKEDLSRRSKGKTAIQIISRQLNLHSIIIILKKFMLTRKILPTSTLCPKVAPTKKYNRLSANAISKKNIRTLVKGQFRAISKAKCLRKSLSGRSGKAESLLELIDESKCECPICLEIAVSPILLTCGHSYCLKCFEENSIFNLRCCLCRLQVSPEEILAAKMIQGFIHRFILPNSQHQINYWCRQGEFSEWELKRQADLHSLRVGDNVDVRADDNSWRRGVIASFFIKQHDYCAEIRYCLNGKMETIEVGACSRRVAASGFFTKGQYLKYRTVCYESKFVESIQIPEIACDFRDQSPQVVVAEHKLHQQPAYQRLNNDLALELFQYQMKEWDNVFQLN